MSEFIPVEKVKAVIDVQKKARAAIEAQLTAPPRPGRYKPTGDEEEDGKRQAAAAAASAARAAFRPPGQTEVADLQAQLEKIAAVLGVLSDLLGSAATKKKAEKAEPVAS